jgi:hypothetical protein
VAGVQHEPPGVHVSPDPHVHVIVVPLHVSWTGAHEPGEQLSVGHTHVFELEHVLPPGHDPHLTSSPHELVTVPHLPVHTAGGGGVGHFVQLWRTPPHPSETPVPGSQTPGLAHVSGVQPQVFVVVLQGADVHWLVPQSIVTPQPVSFPHRPAQSAAVGGTHATHWFVFASQICVAPPSSDVGQDPHSLVTPHESTMVPHSAPAALHAGFVDWQRCVSLLQASPEGHLPQFTASPQSFTVPHAFTPIAAQIPGTQPSPPTAPSGRISGPASFPPFPPPLPPASSPPLPGPPSPPASSPPPLGAPPSAVLPIDPIAPLPPPLPSTPASLTVAPLLPAPRRDAPALLAPPHPIATAAAASATRTEHMCAR